MSGTSGDHRDVLAAHQAGDADATLALDVYLHRLVREIGAMVTSAGGLDLLVFTGGIGEHAPELRAAVADRLSYLGVELDAAANEAAADANISAPAATVHTVVVTAAEDVEVAHEIRRVLDW